MLQLSWRYRDPGRLVAERLGIDLPRESIYTVMGGNLVQRLVNETGRDIVAGRNDLVLLTGGEAWRSRTDARKRGTALTWTHQGDDVEPARTYGSDESLVSPHEMERGIVLPVQVYPMLENALRAADGISRTEHLARIGALYARASEVAATNPHAWIRDTFTADELVSPTPDNRMIGYPYTKRLNSNNMVDQGAALIMCSVERAEQLGIPRDRWVFLHAGTDADDHWFISERDELYTSPAMRTAGRRVLELADVAVDDLAHVDLYSCFPSAVQIAGREIGLGSGVGSDRVLTVTGGMSFAGGPWNNYVMHSIATTVERLREDEGGTALVSGNGGYLTEHSFGVLSTAPPPDGTYRWASTQAEVDALPRREVDTEPSGEATIETYTVMHDRDGAPERALVAVRTPEQRRGWVTTDDADTMRALLEVDEPVGLEVKVRSGSELDLA
jgi:acetyl-CoA C-acetyltransferase